MPELGSGEFTEIEVKLELSVKFIETGWMWRIHNVDKPEADREGAVGSLEEGKAHLQGEFGPFLKWTPCFRINADLSKPK
jgi:hypothetical protein